MKIDLLSSGKPIGTVVVDDLARPAVIRVIANVFDEQIGVGAKFPLYDKRRFGDRIALLGFVKFTFWAPGRGASGTQISGIADR